MGLSSDLISQFVKATNDNKNTKKETTTVYGTAKVGSDGKTYVQLDGSKIVSPAQTAVDVKEGNRVIVTIKNHVATITGNLSDPSASSVVVKGISIEAKKITELEVAVAKRVTTEKFNAAVADIDKLQADTVVIQKDLTASKARIDAVEAENVTINGKVSANEGEIVQLKTNKLDVEAAKAKYATIDNLDVTNETVHNLEATYSKFEKATVDELEAHDASIEELETKKLDAESAKVLYANIDFSNIGKAAIEKFFSKSGMIGDLVVGDGTITGKLVGVTISGDLIEGNTVKAEKLVVKGSDGLYYKLNIEAGATTSSEVSESDLQNGLHGTAIIAKTITAEKISVDDLVAFGATIGGFHITKNALYSGVKDSANNTTRGSYLDSDGQFVVGDSSNFLKYYKDTDGNYKLAISASSILLGSGKKSVETAISDVQSSVEDIQVGGRNLYIETASFVSDKWINSANWPLDGVDSEGNVRRKCGAWAGLYQVVEVKAGDVYTLSANILGDGVADIRFYAVLYDASPTEGGSSIGGVDPVSVNLGIAPTTEKRFSQTIKVTSNGYLRTRIENSMTDAYIWVSSLKLERGTKATDWTPAPEDVNSSISSVNTKADNAASAASAAQNDINNLEVGGRNLIVNSSFSGIKNNGTAMVFDSSDNMVTFYSNILGDSKATSAPYISDYGKKVMRGATITLSGEYMLIEALEYGTTNPWVGFQTSVSRDATTGGSTQYFSWCGGTTIDNSVLNKWIKVSRTYTITDYDIIGTYFLVLFRDVKGSIKFRNLKVEIGNKATDWTPAPEDVSSSIDEVNTKADNATTVANSAQNDIDNLEIGSRNLYIVSNSQKGYLVNNTTTLGTQDPLRNEHASDYIVVKEGEEYVFQTWVTVDETDVNDPNLWMAYDFYDADKNVIGNRPAKRSLNKLPNGKCYDIYKIVIPTGVSYMRVSARFYADGQVKLEKGNRPTEWTPAPEDMATSDEVNLAQSTADEAKEKAENAETLIAQLSDRIAMLVTDGNGTSLMTQTEDGWTFSTAKIQSTINDISENLNSLTTEVGGVDNTVTLLQQAVDDLGTIAEYVKIKTYEDEPCIELGEGDSEFKLRITNTRMMFTEGSTVLAYFNNQSFHSKKIVVEEEFQQGGFVWKVRSNGNLALMWKGDDE